MALLISTGAAAILESLGGVFLLTLQQQTYLCKSFNASNTATDIVGFVSDEFRMRGLKYNQTTQVQQLT